MRSRTRCVLDLERSVAETTRSLESPTIDSVCLGQDTPGQQVAPGMPRAVRAHMQTRWLAALLAACCGCGGNRPASPDGPTCNPPCDVGQYCSTAGECVDDGRCLVDQDCGDGQKCNASEQICVGGCGLQPVNLAYVAPNLLVVLDRSCSMRVELEGTMTSKWEAAVSALDHVTTDFADDIRWGLTLFPDTTNDRCTQDAIPIPVADNNASAIKTLLTNALSVADPLYPDGPCVTNIDTGIKQARTDPALRDPTRSSFLMLVSDGVQSPTCAAGGGDEGTEAAIAALYKNRAIKTFVVGFGSAVDAPQLNSFAVAGGTALSGATKYYRADTAAQLDQAFQSITSSLVSCSYLLDSAPSDPGLLYVFFNDTEEVPRDPSHQMGWDYDPGTMQITLYGSHCSRLKTREVTDIDVAFGCVQL
jgi:hypothetical protein